MSVEKRDVNNREFFRILYRAPENPILQIDKAKFLIVDLSEGGLKFIPQKDYSFCERDSIKGKIVFGKRGTLDFNGYIIRIALREIAVEFTIESRIPLARIMQEQRLLIQKGKL